MKRDEFLQGDDRFQWTMDTFLDRQTGYFFEMNPAGLMADSYMGTSGDNRNWDGIWNARVRRSEIGWTIEIQIPFTTLSFDPNAPAWGVNFQRSIRRKNEENLWTGHLRNQGLRRMANAGLLVGIKQCRARASASTCGRTRRRSVADSPGRDVPAAARRRPVPSVWTCSTTSRPACAATSRSTPTSRRPRSTSASSTSRGFRCSSPSVARSSWTAPRSSTSIAAAAAAGGGGGGWRRGRWRWRRAVGRLARRGRSSAVRSASIRTAQPQPIDIGAKVTGQVGRQDVGALLLRTRETDTLHGEDFAVFRGETAFLGAVLRGGHLHRPPHARRRTSPIGTRPAWTSGCRPITSAGGRIWSSTLSISGRTQTAGLGDSAAYGARVGFPNNPWDASFSWEVVEPNHAPSIGFVPRAGFKNYNPRFGFNPNFQRHPWLRRFGFSL